ncbi:hypothetical protein PsorP6_015713 [Peronosclerospora sorghi]|uniref:Uncharacterized protein n=1 Tax=Peronosclerospora sorghi TaxID=230839 RepID=A0ACC0WM81_9STRA|nr:hypothetical protein PsorP6_015713 [Peronosclerospora sorghi]
MAATSNEENCQCRVRNPFDDLSSEKDPFPPYDAALAEQASDRTETEVLNWSIDSLAELKPVPISPVSEPNSGVESFPTPVGCFFEDAKQYEILRTPLSAAQATSDGAVPHDRKNTVALMPSSSSPSMHLQGTFTQGEAKLMECQRTVDRFVSPFTPKESPCQRFPPSSRSTALKVAKRKRHKAAVALNSDMEAPRWSASPVAMIYWTPRTVRVSPSPNTLKTTPKPRSRHRLSFGLSPIAWSHPEQTLAPSTETEEDRTKEDTTSRSSTMNESPCTLPLNSTEGATVSQVEEAREGHPAECEGDHGQEISPASSHTPRLSIPTPPAPKKTVGRKNRKHRCLRSRDGTKPTRGDEGA